MVHTFHKTCQSQRKLPFNTTKFKETNDTLWQCDLDLNAILTWSTEVIFFLVMLDTNLVPCDCDMKIQHYAQKRNSPFDLGLWPWHSTHKSWSFMVHMVLLWWTLVPSDMQIRQSWVWNFCSGNEFPFDLGLWPWTYKPRSHLPRIYV